MTALNSRTQNRQADQAGRVADLERLMRQVPSRAMATAPIVLSLTKAAHGFIVGDLIANHAGTWSKVKVGDTGWETDLVGTVAAVLDTDTVMVSLWGEIERAGTPGDQLYMGSTAGVLATTAPAGGTRRVGAQVTATTAVLMGVPMGSGGGLDITITSDPTTPTAAAEAGALYLIY